MKVIIVGGVAAGPKVAARLRRLKPDAEITIIEQGELTSYGACGLPLYLGNLVTDLDELMMTSYGKMRDPYFFQKYKNVNVLTRTRVEKIDKEKKKVLIKHLNTGNEEELGYDYLVLTTGAKPFIPKIPGVEMDGIFTLHHPEDAKKLKEVVREKKIKHLTVIGAGLIGVEAADGLAGPRLKVTICEAQNQVLPKLLDQDMSMLVLQQARKRGLDIRLNCMVKAIQDDETNKGIARKVVTSQGTIETELVVIAVGVRPDTVLAREAGLEIGETGAIKVNDCMRTSDPNIYAGGDCAEQQNVLTGKAVYIPLASTANKQGRVIANNIAGSACEFRCVEGTSVLQAFDLNIGRTGLGEEEARGLGFDPVAVITTGEDSTHYYPMHSSITLKLIGDKTTGRVLGAQVSGQGEGIKRLDVIATALKFKGSIEDIANLDLGYAPPFSTAIDPLIHAANALENKRKGLVQSKSSQEIVKMLRANEKICLVDVREDEEVEATPIHLDDVLVISLGELRDRLREIPKDQTVVTICQLGIRGYEAACLLQSQGFSDVYYLEGGLSVLGSFVD